MPNMGEQGSGEASIQDAVQYAEGAFQAISEVIKRVAKLEEKLSILIEVLQRDSDLGAEGQGDLRDMSAIIRGQDNIIRALVSSDGLSRSSRENLGEVLSGLPDFAAIESAKARIAERVKQREKLRADSEDEDDDVE